MLISGHLLQISKSAAHKFIHNSMIVICETSESWIKFPENMKNVKNHFQGKYGFPNVIGAIDCTHVKIISVGSDNPELFRNRKGA